MANPEFISLEQLQEREYRLQGKSEHDYEGLGEDSDEAAMWSQRTRKVLQQRPLPSYNPFE